MGLTRDDDVRIAHSRDASGLQLIPQAVARATGAEEVAEILRASNDAGEPVTAAGSQTSMTGASISDRGTLLSLASMKQVVDVDVVNRIATVQPGITIGELNNSIRDSGLHFAPDPTSENDATIGGAIACNASGARTLRYGPTRRHVLGVTVVHANGATERYARPSLEKNTVGYAMAQNPVDWFVGSEGTLGIVVEAQLSLEPLPEQLIGLAVPFASLSDALAFVVDCRRELDRPGGRKPQCLELFDREALVIAGAASSRPWDASAQAVIYLEDDASGDTPDSTLDEWLALAEAQRAIIADIRVFQGAQSLRDARVMRHAVPSRMNETGARYIAAGGRKVSTDWAVPFHQLGDALAFSRDVTMKHGAPDPVTYGHAGNGHPHQNFIAMNGDELTRIHRAVEETLRHVVQIGGTVSAEHGLGKLKKEWLALQMPSRGIDAMRALKHALDPKGILAPGNIL